MSAFDGRYAPSPSGTLHVGNLRTALLAWCFARSRGARFLVRVEDLDPQRSRRAHAASALADLARIGIDWDGEPYRQSEHRKRHCAAFEQLRDSGVLYPCWCTRAEIRLASQAPHGAPGAYPGTCRGVSARERERRGDPTAWRLDGGGTVIHFKDELAGARSAPVDDFVVWRGDGVAAYNLAVVVDDADQGIGEVVRGDDLLTSTPRQIRLAELLGLAIPRYAHVPLVLGEDGARLAKRHGAVTLDALLAEGWTLPRLVGWMASSSGLAAAGAAMDAQDALAAFAPERLVRAPSVWPPAQPRA
jgi:glutamyl-tRNA synthetase